MFRVPEKYRLKTGAYGTTARDGNNGVFNVPYRRRTLRVLASDGMDWEHVSVSLPHRTPTWEEMCRIKNLFWEPSDLVVQLHVPDKEHIDYYSTCLHLWRKAGTNDYVALPDSIMV